MHRTIGITVYRIRMKLNVSVQPAMTYILHVDFYASFAQIYFRFPGYFRENLKVLRKPTFVSIISLLQNFREHIDFREKRIKNFRFNLNIVCDALQFHQCQSNQANCFSKNVVMFLCFLQNNGRKYIFTLE